MRRKQHSCYFLIYIFTPLQSVALSAFYLLLPLQILLFCAVLLRANCSRFPSGRRRLRCLLEPQVPQTAPQAASAAAAAAAAPQGTQQAFLAAV